MLFFKNTIENKQILGRMYNRTESMLFFKNFIENEQIPSRMFGCPDAKFFFKNSIEHRLSEPAVWLSTINAFL